MSSQPIRLRPVTPAEERAAHERRSVARLLAVYVRHLAPRFVAAQAHGDTEMEAAELDGLIAVEDALRQRHRRVWGGELQPRLQRVLLELEHRDPHVEAVDCVICRRLLTSGLPITVAELLDGISR